MGNGGFTMTMSSRFLKLLAGLVGSPRSTVEGGGPLADEVAVSLPPEFKKLSHTLDAIIALLEEDGDAQWAAYMKDVQSGVLRAEQASVAQLLRGYGGMGSFNDVILGQAVVDGQFAWKEGAPEKNDALDALRTKAYVQAKAIYV